MTFEEYIPLALRTEVERPYNDRLLHCAMGLVTESVELITHTDETNLKEELGDICWYLAIGYSAVGSKLWAVPLLGVYQQDLIRACVVGSANVLDLTKKLLFYGKEIPQHTFKANLDSIGSLVEAAATISGFTLSDCLEANIAKLRVRYPDKFTSEAAINRNLEKEKEALS